jgi:hypothetical protein
MWQKFQISLETWREILSGTSQYWIKTRAQPTASFYCFRFHMQAFLEMGKIVLRFLQGCGCRPATNYALTYTFPRATKAKVIWQLPTWPRG